MRKYRFLVVLAALALSACGGGSTDLSAGSASSSGTTTSSSSSSSSSGANTALTPASITLIANAPQIESNNTVPVTVTAIVKNASNAVIPGLGVVFSASSGVVATTTTNTTTAAGTSDANGEAAALLTTPGDPTNRSITVTATVGAVSQTVTIAVVGTALALSGPSSLILGASGTYGAALTDSGGAGIANTPVAIKSAAGNTLSTASASTDSTGHVTFTLTASVAGNDTVTVSALGSTAQQALSVSSQSFAITAPAANTSVVLGAAQVVTLKWTNNGAAVANQPVNFASTRGAFTGGLSTATATTDSTGTATISLSSTTAGPAVITASATGVSAQLTINFVATDPSQIDVQASPATIPTSGSSTFTAIVRDAANNLVANQTVDFQLTDITGGALSVASAITDSTGRAQTVYTATTVASTSNGVSVKATVLGVSPALAGTATLTVGGQTVFLSLGTGNTISASTDNTQFLMPFSVQALDSAGNAVTGATVTLTVHSLPPPATGVSATFSNAAYRKGAWVLASVANDPNCGNAWCQEPASGPYCLNEDLNGTGIYSKGEDLNNNGKLDPGDVASVSPGTVVTDSTGSGAVTVTYPQDHADWVQVLLTATATVNGTQASTSAQFWLPILAADITQSTVTPPGVVSPYGTATSCANPN